MRVPVLVLVIAASLVHADPKPAPTKGELACKNLVDDARNLAAKSKLTDAIAKLEACIALVPDDVTALGELGFTAYLAKDLAKAEQATRKALAAQASSNLRGAVFYNLGLILEAKKDVPGAVAAYSDSLRVRPNGIVRTKLRSLDPKAAEAFDPYRPVGMTGPFASIDAFCKTLPKKAKDPAYGPGAVPPPPDIDCTCGQRIKTGTAAPPYKKLEVFLRTCAIEGHKMGSYGNDEYRVGVQLDAGWYVAPVTTLWFARKCDNDVKWPVFAVKDLIAGGIPEVAIEMTNDGECRKGSFWKTRGLVVVGIGPSKAPSATPLIEFKHHEEAFVTAKDGTLWGDTQVTLDVALELAWKADGSLDVKGKTTGLDKGAAGDLLGAHALPFP
jgi:tetratricopeptide (TPR) repeat protein